ncbi:helix-turn-helix domain-containing protein [Phaeodactylibacter sp.]|jgi:DNA-binding HxlR family transcriptional regulator|uniref:winged helix-turn-helix transcriptional regulator n=1 Tax=Phaeodactylibacter sp. TaxID=1940289 RepID=UPI0025D8E4BE|nr:helix-turn-helix domain-containing protein [Phaeodactylibacter sp.]MCI4648117.1 helix-turn-helix transcriptional regulator [Phaeodactylibacter sp.]MCI5090585.1 helix-turn-helix transcriptional regulator [Phaeodactylibacter sp.]
MEERKVTSTNYENEQELLQCPVTYTLSMIGGRWKAAIIWQLTQGPVRFGTLRDRVGKVSDRMLSKQLGELQEDGLVAREAYSEVPPRVEYRLTEKGQSLEPVLEEILKWGLANRGA